MSDTAIRFEHVSKLYELGVVGTGTLSHDIKRWWITSVLHKEDPYLKIGETNDRSKKGESQFVYALKDIDFEVKQGDVLGIIGKNGAGKSTLLKLLSRVTYPTAGNIYTKGRIASLLEVGTGFHPELTGRENIYMNGSILGMRKHEIDRKLDEIVDFSGCERYLDTPVKRYSSGMTVRLGFAIAAHLEPEILVVDEVLAVGDAEFQKKAIGKMQDVSKGEGRTVLFVSHNMTSVRALCNRGVILEHGQVKDMGTASDMIDKYMTIEDSKASDFNLSKLTPEKGNGRLKIGRVAIHNHNSENGIINNTDRVTMEVEILNPDHHTGVMELAGRIRSSNSTYLHYFSSKLKNKVYQVPPKDSFFVTCQFENLPLVQGTYYLGFEIKHNSDIVYWIDEAIKIDIQNKDFYQSGTAWNMGIVLIGQTWE